MVKKSGNKARITVEHVLNRRVPAAPKVRDDGRSDDSYEYVRCGGDSSEDRGRGKDKSKPRYGMLSSPTPSRSRSRSRSSLHSSISQSAASVVKRINKAWRKLSARKQAQHYTELEPNLRGDSINIDGREIEPGDSASQYGDENNDLKPTVNIENGAGGNESSKTFVEQRKHADSVEVRKLRQEKQANNAQQHIPKESRNEGGESRASTRASFESDRSYDKKWYGFDLSNDPETPEDEDTPQVQDPGWQSAHNKSSRPVLSRPDHPIVEVPIHQSRWIDKSFDRGNLSIELVVGRPESGVPTGRTPPSMTWYHLERPNMSFDEFASVSQDVAFVTDEQRRHIEKLLRSVKLKHERQRQHGRTMDPHCTGDVFSEESGDEDKAIESITFLSLPYFSLERLANTSRPVLQPGSPLHPTRPLLQAHFLAGSRKRELSQAINAFADTPLDSCLHVCQLWCLLVNDETIVTCGPLPIESLSKDLITIQATRTAPTADEPVRNSGILMVSDTIGRRWRLLENDCPTWPSFLSLFTSSLLHCLGGIEFLYCGKILSGCQWAEVLEDARKGFVNIEVKRPTIKGNRDAADEIYWEMVDRTLELDLLDFNSVQYADNEVAEGSKSASNIDRHPTQNQNNVSNVMALHVFASGSKGSDNRACTDIAESLDKILRLNPRSRERKAYERIEEAPAHIMDDWLASLPKLEARDLKVADIKTKILFRKRLIVLMAKRLAMFFWPPGYNHVLLSKFWGAIRKICSDSHGFFHHVSCFSG